MSEHNWSGWPGAYCLSCGAPDPAEDALGHDCLAAYCTVCGEGWPQNDFGADGHIHAVEWRDCGNHPMTECTA